MPRFLLVWREVKKDPKEGAFDILSVGNSSLSAKEFLLQETRAAQDTVFAEGTLLKPRERSVTIAPSIESAELCDYATNIYAWPQVSGERESPKDCK